MLDRQASGYMTHQANGAAAQALKQLPAAPLLRFLTMQALFRCRIQGAAAHLGRSLHGSVAAAVMLLWSCACCCCWHAAAAKDNELLV
jgi:hypothetical protein